MIELRNRLRSLGYDARLVNADCFDIHQGGAVHYLSKVEAATLAGIDTEQHPLILTKYIDPAYHGLNRWYGFTAATTQPEQEEKGNE